MMVENTTSFVLFPLGTKRFALPAKKVAELAGQDRVQKFPHTTPLLIGVLMRRGQVIPVMDVAPILVGPDVPTRKFYLIAMRPVTAPSAPREYIAIPVTGECELVTGVASQRPDNSAEYVTASLSIGKTNFDVVDMEKLITQALQTGQAGSAEVSA